MFGVQARFELHGDERAVFGRQLEHFEEELTGARVHQVILVHWRQASGSARLRVTLRLAAIGLRISRCAPPDRRRRKKKPCIMHA
jgi:hypothetical protein